MKEYPRLIFIDGITSLTDTTANTVVGFMFAVVLAGLTKEGQNLFINNVHKMNEDSYFNMLETFESLLCFWAWLKKETFWILDQSNDQIPIVENAIFTLMRKIKDI